MAWHALVVLAAVGVLLAQESRPPAAERVAAVLRSNDPALDGKGAGELLGPDAGLDAAILAVARSKDTERLVRLRALRLARLLGLAQRLRDGQGQRDVCWWLAFDEVSREVPEPMRQPLLSRTGMDAARLAEVTRELAAAGELAKTFCTDWNEMRVLDAAHAEENKKYDALEAELKKVGAAAVPVLLSFLVVPPDVTVLHAEDGTTGRQQVRALLALSLVLQVKQAMPFFVMHTATHSLTGSSHASMAIQAFSGQEFGAAFLNPGDEAAIMSWWNEHMAEHPVVLGYLVQHVARLAERQYCGTGAQLSEGLWGAVLRVNRVLGDAGRPPQGATVESLRARLLDAETLCLQRECR